GLREALAKRNATIIRPEDRFAEPPLDAYFWRLRDPGHADVARARRLLEGIQGDLGAKARRWHAEIDRNNTVLTFDVTGAYAAHADAPVLFDARAAERVTFSLYRVRKPDDLVWALDHIGSDFVFRDHGLQYDKPQKDAIERLREAEKVSRVEAVRKLGPTPE